MAKKKTTTNQSKKKPKEVHVISGYIRTENNLGVPNKKVKAICKKVGGKQQSLGKEVQTDKTGHYHIDYTGEVGKLSENQEAYFWVQVDNIKSKLLIDIPREAHIDLVVPNEIYRGPSEFEKLHSKIFPLIKTNKSKELTSASIKNLTEEDIQYITTKLKRTPSTINRYTHAQQLYIKAKELKKSDDIPAEVFYGLIGYDSLPELKVLVSQNKQSLQQSLKAAVKSNIISNTHEPKIEKFSEDIKEIANQELKNKNIFTIKRLLKLNKKLALDQEALMKEYISSEGRTAFVSKLKNPKNKYHKYVGSVEELFMAADLTKENMPLIQNLFGVIQKKHKNTNFKGIKDFAKNSKEEWEEFLKKDEKVLENLPNDSDGNKMTEKDYAQHLATAFKKRFPMVDFVHSLETSKLDKDTKPSKALIEFFEQYTDFDLQKTTIDQFSKNTNLDNKLAIEVKEEIRGWQRLYKLLPDDDLRNQKVIALKKMEVDDLQSLDEGKVKIDSALKIASLNKEDFVTAWENIRQNDKNNIDKREEAEEIYKRARAMTFMVFTEGINYAAPLEVGIPLAVNQMVSSANSNGDRGQKTDQTIANLSTLFGDLNHCESKHCQSVLSPAAYLAELYHLLNKKARTALEQRRPDILKLELNCKNTETKLPYIDLANEILENKVLEIVKIGRKEDKRDFQTTYTEKELALRPEHENQKAYSALTNAIFPISVPWDKWFEEAQLYLDYMELPLHRLIEAFVDPTVKNEQYDYRTYRQEQLKSEKTIRALLRMSVPTYNLITRNISGSIPKIFGLPYLKKASKLSVFMNQLDLCKENKEGDLGEDDFIFVGQLLGTKYIQDSGKRGTPNTGNGGRPGNPPHTDGNGRPGNPPNTPDNQTIEITFSQDHPCDYNKAELTHITRDTLVRITKFEHLRRVLQWNPMELHQAIMIFTKAQKKTTQLKKTAINENFIRQVSHVVRLKKGKRRISILELLSWWGTMEIGAGFIKVLPTYQSEQEKKKRETLYEKVFLDTSLYAPNDQSERKFFELEYLSQRTNSKTISEHKSIVLAALQLSENDLSDLIKFLKGRYEDSFNDTITLENLSFLYRVVSITRYIDITIQEFILSHTLINIDPFEGVHGKGEIMTESTILFIEAVEQICHSSFSLRDLGYLWKHYTEGESNEELKYVYQRIEEYLPQLKQRLSKEKKKTEAITSSSEEGWVDMIEDMMKDIGFSDQDTAEIKKIIKGPIINPEKANAGIQRIFKFLTAEQINNLKSLLVSDRPDSFKKEHYQSIVNLLTYPHKITTILSQELSVFLNVPQKIIKKLLTIILPNTRGDQSLLNDFIDVDWKNDDAPVHKETIINHLLRLEKISAIVRKWNLSADEIEYIDKQNSEFYGFIWESIPIEKQSVSNSPTPTFEQWSALATYVEVRNSISNKKEGLIDLFKTAMDQNKGEETLKKISDVMHLKFDEVKAITKAFGFTGNGDQIMIKNNAFRNGESLKPIIEMAKLIKQSGHSFTTIKGWVKGQENYTLDAAFEDDNKEESLQYKIKVVNEIRNAVKAHFGDELWQKVARELQHKMRILQRDKLLDFLITEKQKKTLENKKPYQLINSEMIYDLLLIDPKINPCMQTTRLKQAISSVQLYIHRILMGLEPRVKYDKRKLKNLKTEWKWKKNYRVWEAHRKVFLYPENWIEPELRDNKTPFFEEFEDKLSQSEIDEKTIEKAFKSYLQKVDEVGHLEIAAFTEDTNRNEFHVIGRTREKPRSHFYRKRNENNIWEPWQRIDLDIEAEVILLTVFNGILYMFWPSIKERIQKLGQDNPDDKNNDKNNYLPVFEIRFNWSRYEDQRWQPKKKSDQHLELMYDWKYKELFEKPEKLICHQIHVEEKKIVIKLSILADMEIGLIDRQPVIFNRGIKDNIKKCTWDEEKIDEKFLEVDELIGKIDWAYIHGTDFTLGANDIKEMLKGPLELTKLSSKLHFHLGNPNTAINLINSLGGIRGIIENTLDDMPLNYNNQKWDSNTPNEKGLRKKDRDAISRLIAMSSWRIDEEYINLKEYRYRYLSIEEKGITENASFTFAELELSGYKLKAQAYNGLGLVKYRSAGSNWQNMLSDVELKRLPKPHHYNSSKISNSDHPHFHFLDETADPNLKYKVGFTNNSILLSPGMDSSYKFEYLENNVTYEVLMPPSGNSSVLLTTGDLLDIHKNFYHTESFCYFLEKGKDLGSFYPETYFHPFITEFNNILNNQSLGKLKDRISKLLKLELQSMHEDMLFSKKIGLADWDYRKVYFNLERPFGLYNWEIFFHMPFTVAVRLSQNKKFEEAQQWFHYIFNPLASLSLNDSKPVPNDPSRFWNVLPLHALKQPDSIYEIWEDPEEKTKQLIELAKDPFQPHRIARLRLGAYQKVVVMKYLDNLIAWGDYLFERDTIESINEATHLYVLAAKILGSRPKIVPAQKSIQESANGTPGAAVLKDLHNSSKKLERVEAELMLPQNFIVPNSAVYAVEQAAPIRQFYLQTTNPKENKKDIGTPANGRPFFSVPHNEKLLAYWDSVANRLFKIRNCQNIAGQLRDLPIFEPPIDPGLLVRGTALGIDISELLSDLYAPLPPYRFRMMLQKAYEFCGDVRSLGGALLSALEKKDSEELSLLRAGQEKQMLKLTEQIKKQQIRELRENLKSTHVSLEIAEARYEYNNSRKFENRNEKQHVSKLNTANDYSTASQIVSLAASAAYAVPQFLQNTVNGSLTVEQGGRGVGDGLQALSSFLRIISSIYSHEANMHSIQGSRERRMDDWQFQAQQARKEIKQLQKQILAAEIRINIAEKELSNHEQQIENAEEVETFMKSKFTNKQLYHWMVSQVSGIYFQTYKLATDLAKQAQKCCRYEKGDDSLTYIGAAYWDNLKKGLLAGEKLQFDLRRMEEAYLRKNARDLEITKSISLRTLDPIQLHTLRTTGSCTIDIPELLFDLDYPGQYFRRIKSISVSIPAVVGPYSGVNCMLTLETSKIRKEPRQGEEFLSTDPSGNNNQIALSSGQNDSGLFELNHNDERYLPFEYRGVISRWKLEFPGTYPQFDWSTITDVIFQMRYTTRPEEEGFKNTINGDILNTYNTFLKTENKNDPHGMSQSLDVKRDFPDLWHQFVSNTEEHKTPELKLALTKEHFPYLLHPLIITVTHVSLFCELKKKLTEDKNVTFTVDTDTINSKTQAVINWSGDSKSDKYWYSKKHIKTGMKGFVVPDDLIIKPGNKNFDVNTLKELIVILHFEVATKDK